MRDTQRVNLGLCMLAAALAALLAYLPAGAEESTRPTPVRIGLVKTLFRDQPESLVRAVVQPFGAMMEEQTGVPGELICAGDALQLGQLLADDKVQLGVFHGIEFAWARQQHPELRPLMIAVNQDCHLRASLVVRKEARAESMIDLKGMTLALPRGTREHCLLFLQRRCQECGLEAPRLFAKITTPPNVEEALDDLVDNDVQAALVDNVSLECFKRRKPGRYARLRVAQESEVFPAGVLAYKEGAISEDILNRFRDGMVEANKTPLGRQLMTLWRLTSFEPVPADYEETLANIVKAYPPQPSAAK